MLIDTHAHLNLREFDKDREKIIDHCLRNDIYIINVGLDYETSQKAIEIAEKYNKGVYASIAIHPHSTGKERFNVSKFKQLAKSPKVVAIGESGLDYMFCEHDKKMQKLQEKVFIQHLQLAKQLNKPIIIHCRKLFPEILKIIKQNLSIKPKGVLHCYMGRWSYAQQYLDLGFYISFTGLITYARDYDKVIRNTPIERIMVETDAPYLIPEPVRSLDKEPKFKGRPRNEPQYVKYITQKIAEVKGVEYEQLADQTTQNAKQLFRI